MKNENIPDSSFFAFCKVSAYGGVNAKTVLAEFETCGKKSAAKTCSDAIINKMAGNGYFDYYNFLTDKKGRELLEELVIDDKTEDKKYLTCKDISKIMYIGKALYVRIN